ncbi:hypothetical protein NS220_08905 [Microbacterium testaceum]|uniref:Uncharacterized protein n=2 Tax=Microbacterium testaceum TaxID=2033 RepID=A0A147EX36_MICTE|nr:hypothetical protein NS220_08905 [Microbacterium testaceum]
MDPEEKMRYAAGETEQGPPPPRTANGAAGTGIPGPEARELDGRYEDPGRHPAASSGRSAADSAADLAEHRAGRQHPVLDAVEQMTVGAIAGSHRVSLHR